MILLTAFGLFAVSAMLVCYALESRSSWWILGFAVSCWLGSAYGFLQGGLAVRPRRSHLGRRRRGAMAVRAQVGLRRRGPSPEVDITGAFAYPPRSFSRA